MSKLQKIKDLASHKKGLNDNAVQYLLSFIESLEIENKHLWKSYELMSHSGDAFREAGKANVEKVAREKRDLA